MRRAIARSPRVEGSALERCDLCGAGLMARHRHVLDLQDNSLLCACQACSLLFNREAAGRGHYRLVPEGRTMLPPLSPKELGVPVGLAFFVVQPDGSVVANYPSPMGATQWELDSEVWAALCERQPVLGELEPGVQALLLNTARSADEAWIVPIDDCFRLVAVIRQEWRGLSGGSRVWPAIEEFFAGLRGRRTSQNGIEKEE
ncbi:hypothetical protein FOS14_04040 [Skermania sp. ID1734]|nr:hypothetical protein FOS14_04040 [Skermania sp. ID1734]